MLIRPYSEFYLDHFSRFFGKPFDVHRYRAPDEEALRLATFDQAYPNFKVLATLGLADRLERLQDLGEVILVVDELGEDVRQLFLNFMFLVAEKNIPLGSRFAVGGIERIDPEFAEYYDKAALYVFPIGPEDGFKPGFEEVDCPGRTGEVFQALFISWPEQDLVRRRGGEALEEKIRALEEDEACKLSRPSVV